MKFQIIKSDKDTKARAGIFKTDHGDIETPIFMPVGTAGTVKGVHQHELKDDINASIILGNTYHLYLRPGVDIIGNAGGLHKFMNWDRPILTDSGGYQVFSLSDIRKIREKGATFSSHIDGSKHEFTAENVVDIQRVIGADIMMALDECTPYPCEYSYAKKSLAMTQRWLERGWNQYKNTQALYGYSQSYFPIVQGSVYSDLRIEASKHVIQYDADGYAIGGLSVGEPAEDMYGMTDLVTDILPENKPRYLMGVGTPANILESIERGIDMLDCVMPARNARNGMLFTCEGTVNIRNNKWKDDYGSIDEMGISFVDTQYSKAYLRHLIISKEILGAQIATIHNLGFYLWLVKTSREKILTGEFSRWKRSMVKKLSNRL
jgi:queuine tRNA-ribosyltransferase